MTYVKSYTAWADYPVTTTPATAAKLQNIDDGIATVDSTVTAVSAVAYAAKRTVSAYSAGPPGSPATGNVWIGTNVDANGTAWQFCYNSAEATYKWEFVGGPPMLGVGATAVNLTGAGTWVSIRTLTMARAGDYDVRGGFRVTAGATNVHHIYCGVAANAPNFTNNQSQCTVPAAYNGYVYSLPIEDRVIPTAGQTIVLSGTSSSITGGTDATIDSWLAVTPVRII